MLDEYIKYHRIKLKYFLRDPEAWMSLAQAYHTVQEHQKAIDTIFRSLYLIRDKKKPNQLQLSKAFYIMADVVFDMDLQLKGNVNYNGGNSSHQSHGSITS